MDETEKDKRAGESAGELATESMAGFLFGDERGQIRLRTLRTRLRQSLNAKEEKAFKMSTPSIDAEGGKLVLDSVIYSKKMVAHGTRLQAQKICFELLNAFPAKTVRHEGEIEHTHKDELSPELQSLFEKIVSRDQDSST